MIWRLNEYNIFDLILEKEYCAKRVFVNRSIDDENKLQESMHRYNLIQWMNEIVFTHTHTNNQWIW